MYCALQSTEDTNLQEKYLYNTRKSVTMETGPIDNTITKVRTVTTFTYKEEKTKEQDQQLWHVHGTKTRNSYFTGTCKVSSQDLLPQSF